MTEYATRSFNSPIGQIFLRAHNNKIVSLIIASEPSEDSGQANVLDDAENQLLRYLSGQLKVLNFDVELNGTEFQKAVWAEIAKTGFGETKSYADIALAIGKPKGSRAVGGAVGANPVPLIIGCHRILGSSGKLTGYSGGDGLPTKRWLLKLEGIPVKE